MTLGEPAKNLPWVEKYRPSKLEDLVSHDDILNTIKQFMKENQLPHLLFYGPPGTGKTSTILACAKQMYTPQQFNSMVLELNASDDRGIGIVRGQILNFASTRTIFKAGPKLIILDEADAMTNDAQNALRRILFESTLCARYLGCASTRGSGGTRGADVMAGQCLALRPPVPLQLCDVAGSALSNDMLDNYLYASDIVVLVYDLTNLKSFEKLDLWLNKVKVVFQLEPVKPLLAIFGNKSDLEHQRAVRLSCVQKFASEHLLEHYKGSARTGEMVNNAVTSLIARVLGLKVQAPPIAPNRKSSEQSIAEQSQNGQHSAPHTLEASQSLLMTRKAFRKLKRKESSSVLIEKYTENVRFCIICNYLGKIIPALQSRCTRFRFAPLQHSQIVPRLQEIVKSEGVKMSDDGMKALLTLSGGDMRKVLNTLQSTWLAHRDVTELSVYTCVGHPLRSDINNILNWLLNENDFSVCFNKIQDLKIAKGLALSDILTEVHSLTQRVKLPPEVITSLWIKMADAEMRLAGGSSERLELASLIAAFQQARDQVQLEP